LNSQQACRVRREQQIRSLENMVLDLQAAQRKIQAERDALQEQLAEVIAWAANFIY
jgi:hypothetical protein